MDIAGEGRQVRASGLAVHSGLGPVLADHADEETAVMGRYPPIVSTAAGDTGYPTASLSRTC